MAMVAYAFLQHRRLASVVRGGKKNPPRAASANAPRDPKGRYHRLGAHTPIPMPALPSQTPPQTAAMKLPK